jgi:predicted alpha/beta-hydrolase family hydrolase
MPKRKRNAVKDKQGDETLAEDGHDIVGGLKDPTGNTRSTGSAANNTDQVTHFQVPFNDKQIVCERHRAAKSTKKDNGFSLVFTHGAGGGINNPATKDFVTGFASAASEDAISFQGTMNLVNRTKTFHAVLGSQGRARALGGRSMGSRAAVITATESEENMRPEALVLVSYPLTSEKTAKPKKGKENGADPRKQILLDLPKDVDVLFVIGSKDGMCGLDALNSVRKDMSAKSWVMEVKNADHGMSFTPKAGVQPVRLRTGALAAEWLEQRGQEKRYCSVEWTKEDGEVVVSGWLAARPAFKDGKDVEIVKESDEPHSEDIGGDAEKQEAPSKKRRISSRKAPAKKPDAETGIAAKKRRKR